MDDEENTIVGFISLYSDLQREIGRLEGISFGPADEAGNCLWDVAQNISDMVDHIFGVEKDEETEEQDED